MWNACYELQFFERVIIFLHKGSCRGHAPSLSTFAYINMIREEILQITLGPDLLMNSLRPDTTRPCITIGLLWILICLLPSLNNNFVHQETGHFLPRFVMKQSLSSANNCKLPLYLLQNHYRHVISFEKFCQSHHYIHV